MTTKTLLQDNLSTIQLTHNGSVIVMGDTMDLENITKVENMCSFTHINVSINIH